MERLRGIEGELTDAERVFNALLIPNKLARKL